MDELFSQTRAVFVNDDLTREHFTKQIAFNVIPHIDVFRDNGDTKEEWKMVVETQKMLDPEIRMHATCVRVPVFVGHSEAVNIEFETPISETEARAALKPRRVCCWSTGAKMKAMSRRSNVSANMKPSSRGCALTRRLKMG